ncbi:MAG TPA: enoyl-CoA hydratase/isomerase family protein [Steroidobacteraceae bacterium]|nr:enoyl-CoA hydratase/isomerase family protein [Steroidobacteraceae bacterium]
MSDYQFLQLEYRAGCATVWLNRPERHNVFHQGLLSELPRCLTLLSQDAAVRAIVLAGRGHNFCAGADLEWMQQQARAGYDANLEDARRLAWMLRTLAQVPKPTIARVHGVALGGGMGLVAACDIAMATREASFATTEVRLGLTPSTIAPYVIAAIGERAARRYFLSGERFDAQEALRIGLIHEALDADALDARVGQLFEALRSAGPQAQAHCKRLLASLRGHDAFDPLVLEQTARSIAEVRAGDEAREGIAAFFAKRKPSWTA